MLATWNDCPPLTVSVSAPQRGQVKGNGGETAAISSHVPQVSVAGSRSNPSRAPAAAEPALSTSK